MSLLTRLMQHGRVTSPRSIRLAGTATAVVVLGWVTYAVAVPTVTYVQIDASGPPGQRGKDAGDIDGDGQEDIVVASTGGQLVWYKNPTAAKSVIAADTATSGPITVADLDGINGNDVIVPIAGGAVWFANNGNGTGWTKRVLPTSQKVHDAEVGDLDGDGKNDVLVRNEYPGSTSVAALRQISPTSWVRTVVDLPEAGSGLEMADIDRDGKLDFVVGKYWYKNSSTIGSISFLPAKIYNINAEQDALIAIGRINNDRRLDLFITSPHPSFSGGGTTAWYAQPLNLDTTWRRVVLETYVRREFHSAVIADLDGDGDNDLATATTVATRAAAQVKVFLNRGSGVFDPPLVIANKNSHELHFVVWDGKPSLFGSSKAGGQATSVDLWQLTP